ncbi:MULTISPECIES: hypothetical protein [Bacillus]|uniref:hypothetical protein n=1 Tax=Bacillus TaxID=1386 RepID=UPI00073C4D0B|nr:MULTISPECIES: hypothetical protein [Bacillus]KTF59826.1 hypothetical protein AR691_13930 [Bacillus amyloliquefaciens]MCH4866792.1 hypothetical protein [Bacillus sp. 1006-3]
MDTEVRKEQVKQRLETYRDLTRKWGNRAIEVEKALTLPGLKEHPRMILEMELANCKRMYKEYLFEREQLTDQLESIKAGCIEEELGFVDN